VLQTAAMASIASPYKALQLPLGALFALSEVLSGSALNTTALMVLLCLHMRRLQNRLHSRIGGNACSEEVRADGGPSSAQDGLVEPAPPQSSKWIYIDPHSIYKNTIIPFDLNSELVPSPPNLSSGPQLKFLLLGSFNF